MGEFTNVNNAVHVYAETEWGVTPASPVYVPLPHDSYDVTMNVESRMFGGNAGLRQRRHKKGFRGMPQGNLALPLYGWQTAGLGKSVAEYLLDFGFADAAGSVHESIDLPSLGAEYTEGPDVANKRHSGLRVNTCTVSGTDSAGRIDIALDLMGRNETGEGDATPDVATSQPIPADQYELTEFDYTDVVFELSTDDDPANYAVLPTEAFNLQVANNLLTKYVGSTRPTLLKADERATTFSVTTTKKDDVWDAYRRNVFATAETDQRFAVRLTLKGLHKGTGAADTQYTQCVITLPSLAYNGHADDRSRGTIAMLPLTFDVLKPDTAANDVNVVWSDVAAA
ncbi:MAG: phage tail tube protein [Planctomycetota bacterium]